MSLNDDLWRQIEGLYEGTEASRTELSTLRHILPTVETTLAGRYTIVDKIAKGGTGLVLKVTDENLGINRALKCARPVAGREPAMTKILAREIAKLKGVSHPNVVGIYFTGSVTHNNMEWPYYVMDYMEGGKDCCDHLIDTSITIPERGLLDLFRQIMEGVAHLHSRDMLHGDIKLENALIAPTGHVMISDLGSARHLSREHQETVLTFTPDYAHPKLREHAKITADPNRAQKELPRCDLSIAFDLYALGKNMLRVLRLIEPVDTYRLTPRTRAYLELLAARLLDGENLDPDEFPLDLTRPALAEIKYHSLEPALEDMRALAAGGTAARQLDELNQHPSNTIQCSYPSVCAFTDNLARTLRLSIFKRLGNVSQLGLIGYIYPTATHTRLEHVLGTYANTVRYCLALLEDPINPFFRQLMKPKDIRTLLCASLCHDLGQYGLAHDFEEANKEIFSHVALTVKLLRGELAETLSGSLRDTLRDAWRVDPEAVADILETDPTDLTRPLIQRLCHTIIDGPLDADKLDYLVRDSRVLGVPYGDGIDLDRLLRCLTVVIRKEGEKTYVALGIHEKAKIAAEAVAFARYAMFGCVYWHHTSRCLKSMLHRAIWLAIPTEDERTADFQKFKEEFEGHAVEHLSPRAHQLLLFGDFRPGTLPYAYTLSNGDRQMLEWLYEHTSVEGKRLLRMIAERTLFSRLLVISSRRRPSLWDTLQKVRQRLRHDRLCAFQMSIQQKLVDLINQKDIKRMAIEKRATAILTSGAIERIAERHSKGEVLILVDIPPERPGSASELEFLCEERIRGVRHLGRVAPALEDSVIWEGISSKFVESVGKIRVFVDPELSDQFELLLDREEIEPVLQSVARNYLAPAPKHSAQTTVTKN